MQPPQLPPADKVTWELTINEHRRALLERFLLEFPDIAATKSTAVEIWRAKLSGPRTSR